MSIWASLLITHEQILTENSFATLHCPLLVMNLLVMYKHNLCKRMLLFGDYTINVCLKASKYVSFWHQATVKHKGQTLATFVAKQGWP